MAVPMKLVSRKDMLGVVELDGVQREVSLMLLPDAQVGQYLLVHAGYAISQVDEQEAESTLALVREVLGAENQ